MLTSCRVPVSQRGCSSRQEQGKQRCAEVAPSSSCHIAVWGLAVVCGPLAFLQHFCLLFPSLFSWQDFLLRKLSRYQQLPPASRAWHRNTYTSEKPRGLIVGIRDTSVTLSGLNTPPGEILHPSSSADGSFVCQTSLKSAPSLASFQ